MTLTQALANCHQSEEARILVLRHYDVPLDAARDLEKLWALTLKMARFDGEVHQISESLKSTADGLSRLS